MENASTQMESVIEVHLLAYMSEETPRMFLVALVEKLIVHKKRTIQIREQFIEAIFSC